MGGRHAPESAYIVASAWCGLRDDLLRRPRQVAECLRRYLKNAVERGELSDFKFDTNGTQGWRDHWQITFGKPPTPVRSEPRCGLREARASEDETSVWEIVDIVLDWMNEELWEIKLPQEELRKQIERTVRCYGVEPIWEIMKEAFDWGMTPYVFWERVRDLKKIRRQKRMRAKAYSKQQGQALKATLRKADESTHCDTKQSLNSTQDI